MLNTFELFKKRLILYLTLIFWQNKMKVYFNLKIRFTNYLNINKKSKTKCFIFFFLLLHSDGRSCLARANNNNTENTFSFTQHKSTKLRNQKHYETHFQLTKKLSYFFLTAMRTKSVGGGKRRCLNLAVSSPLSTITQVHF
jgi:hypothetical protein